MAETDHKGEREITLACAICSNNFTYIRPRLGRHRRFCSGACFDEHRRRYNAERLKTYVPPPAKLHSKVCVECGVDFKTSYKAAICCGVTCGALRGKRESDIARTANALARRARICERCDSPFVGFKLNGEQSRRRHQQRYCGVECAGAARRKPKPLKACIGCSSPLPKGRISICSDACSKERREYQCVAPRSCKACGVTFEPSYGDKRRTFCSSRCNRKLARLHTRAKGGPRDRGKPKKRARKYGVEYEPVDRLKVFERDRWRCQVCGERTPKRLVGSLDDRAPELDHRIPMAMGGGHTWANVQCACRRCNAAKGAVRIVGQLPLFERL